MKTMVAWLCVVVFGLNSAVLSRGFVQCTDSDGSTRLEWICERDSAGHCDETCAGVFADEDSDHHSESTPCEDSPLTTHICASHRDAADGLVLPLMILAPVVCSPTLDIAIHVSASAPVAPVGHDPPSALKSIRTIVLLV